MFVWVFKIQLQKHTSYSTEQNFHLSRKTSVLVQYWTCVKLGFMEYLFMQLIQFIFGLLSKLQVKKPEAWFYLRLSPSVLHGGFSMALSVLTFALPVSGWILNAGRTPSLCIKPYFTTPLAPSSASVASTCRTTVPEGWFSRTEACSR